MRAIVRFGAIPAIALLLGACIGRPGSTAAASPLVVDQTLTIPYNEGVRVRLAGGVDYRAELGGSGMQIQLRPIDPGVSDPDVRELLPGNSAGGVTLYTIRPRVDALYEFRTVGGELGRAVTLRVVRAPVRTEARP